MFAQLFQYLNNLVDLKIKVQRQNNHLSRILPERKSNIFGISMPLEFSAKSEISVDCVYFHR